MLVISWMNIWIGESSVQSGCRASSQPIKNNNESMMAKLQELGFELLPHPPYSPDLAPSDIFLFSDLKRMLAGKKFCADEEIIEETEAYFEAKDKPYYKNGIKKLYGRYNRCIAREGNYIEE